MAAPSMAEVLAKHAYGAGSQGRYCKCGAMGQGDRQANHAAHVARSLAAAGFGHVASVEARWQEVTGDPTPEHAAATNADLAASMKALVAQRDAAEAQIAAARALADRGITGWDLTPAVSGNEDAAWWYAYLRS